ncbi:mediator of RNA polymerase II transcription subunit 1 [Bacillus rossius redtenbacheri]|uniref:mediator of RNA polymerase II transcription subunit 1 n=1 Tax=Bacillus rossius redtenbacheri TaxID=93214 RepID=UPI002FDEB56A
MNVLGTDPAQSSGVDKTKAWQMELLMEKLRSKAGQFKSLVETAKTLRMQLLEKRYSVDSVERAQLQKCLDTLQHSIKVTTLQGMVERLESVSRQLGLKFTAGPSGLDWFISSDMFYLEVMLEPSGAVKDVKISHEGKVEQQSCEELAGCLSRGDFADLAAQLEGLASVYQLSTDKKVKCKAFSALQGLETDLATLALAQQFIKEPFNLVHKSPVGLLQRRRGGHAMALTYLVAPYDLLCARRKLQLPLTVEEVTGRALGRSVQVCLEGGASHKLQTCPLISVSPGPNGKSTPCYASVTAANSCALPACFVLRLDQPMPVALALLRRMQQLTELESTDALSPVPLLSLVTQHASGGRLDCAGNRGLFVSLPDQSHCYFMTESKALEGVMVTSVPFTHPAHVPQILAHLRQQALFNTLVASCVRPASRQDFENVIMFEVTALSWQQLSVSFEHPLEETMTTAELDLSDIGGLHCKVYGSGVDAGASPHDVSKVLQRCWSIPVTMRSLIRTWQCQDMEANDLALGGNLGMPPGSDPGRHPGSSNHSVPEFDVGRVKPDPDGMHGRQGFGPEMSDGFQSPLLQSEGQEPVASTFPFVNLLVSPVTGKGSSLMAVMGDSPGSKKSRKRKNADGSWRSPKRKQNEDCDIMLESSSNESTPLGTPTSQDASAEVEPEDDVEKDNSDFDEEEIMEIEENDFLHGKKSKKDKKGSPPIILDLAESKSLVPPSVSITPISTTNQSLNSVLTDMGLNRRPGIEIIPIKSTPAASLPSSITITPITSKSSSEDRARDRKSSKSRSSDERVKLEKKRKRKREDSPGGIAMGPPEKLPPKQDALSKPVNISIKPTTDSPPMSSVRPSSPASSVRKYASSPTHINLSMSKSGSGKSSSSSHQSPKHSPGYSTSSPKHHGTSSPKHQSSSGSGKPSMSALKSAANSPSTIGKSSSGDIQKSKSSSNKDKDRKLTSLGSGVSSSGSSPKLKSSSVKLKQLDLTDGNGGGLGGGNTSPSDVGGDGRKSSTPQARNRKHTSISDVIDKLNSMHNVSESGDVRGGTGKGSMTDSNKNSEYMVKPSGDGMRITINKTKSKDSKSGNPRSSSYTGTGSPKTHTGLKPGVNSGPASKKPHQVVQQKSPSGVSSGTGKSSGGSSKMPSSKSSGSPIPNIMSKSSSKSTGSPKMVSSNDTSRRDKSRPKNNSEREKSVFSSSKGTDGRKSSPLTLRDEQENYKLMAPHSKMDSALPPQLVVEGLIKTLDTKFQIPKLSARLNASENDSKKSITDKVLVSDPSRGESIPKPLEIINKVEGSSKYPISLKTVDDLKNQKLPHASLPSTHSVYSGGSASIVGMSSKTSAPVVSKAIDVSLETSQVASSTIMPVISIVPVTDLSSEPLELSASRGKAESSRALQMKEESQPNSKLDAANTALSLVLPGKTMDSNNTKFPTVSKQVEDVKKFNPLTVEPPNKMMAALTSSQEAAEILLDFSSSSSGLASKALVPELPPPSKLTTVPERALASSTPGRRNTPPPPPPMFPSSPSVSVHILKSPVTSPLINPSPHSVSPCITDDELMDEALVGMGK